MHSQLTIPYFTSLYSDINGMNERNGPTKADQISLHPILKIIVGSVT
jgi:hypothetical protein